MLNDTQISAGLRTMVDAIDAPPAPLQSILDKIPHQHATPRALPSYLRPALAAAAVIAIGAVALTPGLVRAVDDRLTAMLGWTPPPAPPAALVAKMNMTTVTLAGAQSQVPFSVVAPTGLPNNIASSFIQTGPSGTYTKATHRWSEGSRYVIFSYKRSDGRSFELIADRYDSKAGPAPKYIYSTKDDRDPSDPHAVFIKHEHFVWRNGDQVLSVTEDTGISAREIDAIREAMRGIPLARTESRKLLNGRTEVKLRVRKP